MKLLTPFVTTQQLPHTYNLLETLLPTIYKHKCFNSEKLPFDEEVRKTEIGHLFEHIILEYLCQLKLQAGNKHAKVRGETSWDWNKEKEGIFHITLTIGKEDAYLLSEAIKKSTVVIEQILISGTGKTLPLTKSAESTQYVHHHADAL